MLNKQAMRFINRKNVKIMLKDITLTDKQVVRLNKLFSHYTCKETEYMHETIGKFILNDLTNYLGRYRRLKGIYGTSMYTQVLRYGKTEAKRIYNDQSRNKSKHFKNTKNYWLELGVNYEQAEKMVSEVQSSRSARSPSTQKGTREYSLRCVGYWLKQGYSELEAKEAVANVQRRKHTVERNIRWQETLKSKSAEEIALINKKKGHSIDSCLARGLDLETAIQTSQNYYAKRRNFSQTSQVFFGILETLLETNTVYYKTKNYEKQFSGKCVDFYYADSKIVVEYYGDFWHRNPKIYTRDFKSYGKTSEEIWELDRLRINQIESDPNVYKVLIVWESDVLTNPHFMAEQIVKEIKLCRK